MPTSEKQLLDSLDSKRMLELVKPILEEKKNRILQIFDGKIEILEQKVKELRTKKT